MDDNEFRNRLERLMDLERHHHNEIRPDDIRAFSSAELLRELNRRIDVDKNGQTSVSAYRPVPKP